MLGCRKIFFIGSRHFEQLIITVLLSVVIIAFETIILSHSSSSVTVFVKSLVNDSQPSNTSKQDRDHAKVPGNTILTPAVASDRVSSHPEREAPVRGFLLSVSVDQQLTGGLKGFTQLATLAAIFNLSTVEPYVQGSKLVGVPQVLSQGDRQNVIRLSDLYDWEDLRRKFKTCSTRNDHQLSSFETFLGSASRDVILVYMITAEADFNFYFPGRNKKIIQVGHDEYLLSGVQYLNEWAAKVSKRNGSKFRAEHIIMVDARPTYALPLSVIVKDLGPIIDAQVSKFSSATVLFGRWRAIAFKEPMRQKYYVPGFHWRPCQRIDFIKHSQAVIDSSLTFSQNLNNSINSIVIGVHIRGERLLRDYKGSIPDCLSELDALLHSYTLKLSKVSVRIIHDLGEYGTSSCTMSICSQRRNSFLSQVQRLGYPIVSFNPTEFSAVPVSSGFAAFVEGEYLSKVDILVTLGWGGFQNTVSQRFVRQHGGKEENLHHICNSPSPSNYYTSPRYFYHE